MCLFGWRKPYPSLFAQYERAQPAPWQRCPVCAGRGTLPSDFYSQIGGMTSTVRVTCRSCGGKGMVR